MKKIIISLHNPPPKHLRHNSRQVEDLSRQIRHIAVEEHKEGLNDPGVLGEAGREGANEAVDGSHHDASK